MENTLEFENELFGMKRILIIDLITMYLLNITSSDTSFLDGFYFYAKDKPLIWYIYEWTILCPG